MKIRIALAPASALIDDLVGFADAAEASGFDAVWLSDLPVAPAVDPLLALAMICGRSSRLKLGANLVPLGRNPFLLAKQLAQLDRLCSGRLLLSFVPGLAQPGERAVLGTQGADRGAVLEQTLALVRGWWDGSQAARHEVSPETTRPLQDPLEVWLGGRGPKALERVGRIADGWLGAALTPGESVTARERIQESAAHAGREIDPEHFGLSIAYARSEPDADVLAAFHARRPDIDPLELLPVGPGALRTMVSRYIDAGLSKFVVRPALAVGSWQQEIAWLSDAVADLQS